MRSTEARNPLDFFNLGGNKARKVCDKIRLKHFRKKGKDKNLERKHKVQVNDKVKERTKKEKNKKKILQRKEVV